jgi:predicted GIY-YIG superfamily endonuclease
MPKDHRLEREWSVYILRCADRSLYTGVSTDVPRRVRQHNAGLASRYTRSRLPVQLAYRESSADRGAALRREAAIKRLSRQAKEQLIGLGRSQCATRAPIPCGTRGG